MLKIFELSYTNTWNGTANDAPRAVWALSSEINLILQWNSNETFNIEISYEYVSKTNHLN